jgi:branched-chain amino acid transport system ATP-binding protein
MMGNTRNVSYGLFDIFFRTKKFREEERKSAQHALDVLSMLGIENLKDAYAASLPYGSQRKLEIARAIAADAKLILLDEPAAGMNASETAELMEFVRSLVDKGYTILMIEHDMNMVMNISDRIYVLNFGKLIATGTPREISSDQNVIDAYLGEGDEYE